MLLVLAHPVVEPMILIRLNCCWPTLDRYTEQQRGVSTGSLAQALIYQWVACTKRVHLQVGLAASMCTGMISLSAPPAAAQRTPITLALALDISGSMSLMCQPGVSTVNKLDLCKNTVKFLIQQLRDDDTVSLVTFHAAVRTLPYSAALRHYSTVFNPLLPLFPHSL